MTSTDSDVLDRSQLLNALATAATGKNARNILLAGPWGSGKTTLLRGLRAHVEASGDNAPYVIWFSPWDTVADGDPRMAFLRLLRDELALLAKRVPGCASEKGVLKRVGRLVKTLGEVLDSQSVQAGLTVALPLVGALAPALSGMSKLVATLVENAQDTDQAGPDGDESPTKKMRRGVRRMLLDIAEAANSRSVLLLVDDLDRARPERAVDVLDSLYHLLMPHAGEDDDWPLTSVWAVNTAVLEEYLYREYRELPSFDPNAYLEKLFWQRINVPPLIEGGKQGNTERLWCNQLALELEGVPESMMKELASALSVRVNYAILGNLRLHARVRRDCTRLWQMQERRPVTVDAFIRDARMIVMIDAFSYFREQIAPFNGMWPHFLNQVNKRITERPMEWIANPLYRHVDSPDLATLLVDLGALRFVDDRMRYEIVPEGRSRLQKELNEFWCHGV